MLEDDPELILIVVDNSGWTGSAASRGAKHTQTRAIQLYCHAKLESNPKTAIGMRTISSVGGSYYNLNPTSDVDKVMTHLRRAILYGRDLDFQRGVCCSLSFINQPLPAFQVKAHKRLLFLVGGPTGLAFDTAVALGNAAKRQGVAVDVVNFCLEDENTSVLDAFVSAADNKANSHIKHIQPGSSLVEVGEALSSSPPIITRPSMEQALIAAAPADAAATKEMAKEKADSIRELELLLNLNSKPAPRTRLSKHVYQLSSDKGKMAF